MKKKAKKYKAAHFADPPSMLSNASFSTETPKMRSAEKYEKASKNRTRS